MDADLKALEDKISQLLELCQAMRKNNLELKHSVDLLQESESALRTKIQRASERLESLIDDLPEDEA
jgi:cell division protein ZapB